MRASSVPFFSQTVNWNGEDSGFPNQAAIDEWQENGCGIASLRMVIAALCPEQLQPSYWELLQKGVKAGAYNEVGWIHRGLLDLGKTYALKGQCHRNKTTADVAASLKSGNLCIVSASPGFLGGKKRHDSDRIRGKGGHLVVALDVEETAGTLQIVCHHPSSYGPMNKLNWAVDSEAWENSFSGNYIEFWK